MPGGYMAQPSTLCGVGVGQQTCGPLLLDQPHQLNGWKAALYQTADGELDVEKLAEGRASLCSCNLHKMPALKHAHVCLVHRLHRPESRIAGIVLISRVPTGQPRVFRVCATAELPASAKTAPHAPITGAAQTVSRRPRQCLPT
eukprot:356704-Chlamydomonas_euryale.AAC.4